MILLQLQPSSGNIDSLDTDRNILKLKDVVGTINVNDTITSQTGGHAKVKKFNIGGATVDVVNYYRYRW